MSSSNFNSLSMKELGKGMAWIMRTTWMCAYHDMNSMLEEGWEEGEFFEFWIPNKQKEVDFIGIVEGLVATIVTTCLTFQEIQTSHWLIPGIWYCSVIFSFSSVALAFQQRAGLSGMALGKEIRTRKLTKAPNIQTNNPGNSNPLPRSRPQLLASSWCGILAWQAPVQLLSYALGFFIIGLLEFMSEPFFREGWGGRSKMAVFVFGLSILPSSLYFFSVWTIQRLAGRIRD